MACLSYDTKLLFEPIYIFIYRFIYIYVTIWRHKETMTSGIIESVKPQASKPRVAGLCERNPPVTGGFPFKGPVTRHMFPFDDVIMNMGKQIIWTHWQLTTWPQQNKALQNNVHIHGKYGTQIVAHTAM